MQILTTKEAAGKLGVTETRVRQLILDGRLPATKFGRQHLINESDLSLVAERKTGRPKQSQVEEPPKKVSEKRASGAAVMTQAERRELAEAARRRWKNRATATGVATKAGKKTKAVKSKK